MARSIQFSPSCFAQYLEWREQDDDIFDKINDLIKDVSRDPFKGLGKPEPLKGEFHGFWSRRITKEHRLVYRVEGELVKIYRCFGHYED